MYEIGLESTKHVLLSCEFGMITINPKKTKFGFVNHKMSLERLHFGFEDDCTDYTQLMYSLQPCLGKNRCNITVNKAWVYEDNPSCVNKFKDSSFKTVLGVHCKHVIVSIGGNEPASIIKIYMVNFGFFFMVCFFSFYFIVS